MNLTAIIIVGTICWAIVALVNGPKHRKKDNSSQQQAAENKTLREDMEKLRERVEVLEKIVTDEKYSLKREFENLKKDDAA